MLRDFDVMLADTAGALLPYLDAPDVMEVRVTSAGRVFVVRFGREKERVSALEPYPELRLERFLAIVADLGHAAWGAEKPSLHVAHTGMGFRIEAGTRPTSPGPWMVCRKHPSQVFPLEDFLAKEIITARQKALLEAALDARQTVCFSGAFGSAKTSLLNASLHHLRHSRLRFVILEDDPEAVCTAEEAEFVKTDEDLGITMAMQAKRLLRMSPGWVVVGEVRWGHETLEALKLFQSGHPGLITVHAESAAGTLLRVEQLVLEASLDPQRRLIGEALDVIVHMEQYAGSWRMTEMLRVGGWQGEHYNLERMDG